MSVFRMIMINGLLSVVSVLRCVLSWCLYNVVMLLSIELSVLVFLVMVIGCMMLFGK